MKEKRKRKGAKVSQKGGWKKKNEKERKRERDRGTVGRIDG